MHRATQRMPFYAAPPHVVELRDHAGPILCICKVGPYLFTGGADRRILQYRIASLQIFSSISLQAIGFMPPASVGAFWGFGEPCKAQKNLVLEPGRVLWPVWLWSCT